MKIFLFSASLFLYVNTILAYRSHLDARATVPNESNCGVVPCTTFNAADQYIDVTPGGKNPFIAPKPGDLRGPCPGLNAAANHGFIPRSGIVSLTQTITGMTSAFGMSADFATFLAVLGIVTAGSLDDLTWSIGGPYTGGILSALAGEPEGISYSHNRYEGDASATRADAYINGGDAHSLIMSKFEHLYHSADSYTLENIRSQNLYSRNLSVSTNPYYFSAPFSGLLVAPAAHNFIINFMSNHSAENPNGYLDKAQLKTFFSVTGPDNALVWTPGLEQIPQNWYRRPSSNPYGIVSALEDILVNAALYPETIQVGGNTGTVNSFVGVDLGNLTGGLYDAANLLEGHNLVCFALQTAAIGLLGTIDELLVTVLQGVQKLFDTYLGPIFIKLDCPVLKQYNEEVLKQFPGYRHNLVRPTKF